MVPCLKTSTFCYLLTELPLFFRYWEKIPWSQQRGCNPWDRVTQQWLRRCEGNLLGGGVLRRILLLDKRVTGGEALPFATLCLRLGGGLWEGVMLDAQNVGTLWRPKVSQRRWADQELWFHWLAESTPATPWIQTACYVRKRNFYCLGISARHSQTEEARLLFHNVPSSHMGSLSPCSPV